MAFENIHDGVAVRYDMTFESPLVAEYILEQVSISAAGFPISTVIRAHDRLHFCINERMKGRKVSVPEILLRNFRIEFMTQPFRAAVHGIMFGAGRDLQVLRIVALQTLHEGDAHLRGEIGILSIGLLSP